MNRRAKNDVKKDRRRDAAQSGRASVNAYSAARQIAAAQVGLTLTPVSTAATMQQFRDATASDEGLAASSRAKLPKSWDVERGCPSDLRGNVARGTRVVTDDDTLLGGLVASSARAFRRGERVYTIAGEQRRFRDGRDVTDEAVAAW